MADDNVAVTVPSYTLVGSPTIEAVIAMEDRNQVLCSRSEEFNEGIRAFLEKRKPVYIKR